MLMLLSGRAVLCEFSSLLGSLLWLADTGDLGHFGVSNLEVLVLFEQWAGQQRLPSEKVTRPHVRAHRPISIPSMFVSEGIEIRQECRSISSAPGKLLGGIGRFLPCAVGGHLSRLRHLAWERCSHGLTSRRLESCLHQCLKAVWGFRGYPAGAAAELVDGSQKLRCCTTPFSKRFPHLVSSWRWLELFLVVQLVKEVDMQRLISWMRVAVVQRGSGQPGRHVPGILSMSGLIQGFQRQSDGKGCTPPESSGFWVKSACLPTSSGRLQPAPGGYRSSFSSWSVQPKGPVRWHQSRLN